MPPKQKTSARPKTAAPRTRAQMSQIKSKIQNIPAVAGDTVTSQVAQITSLKGAGVRIRHSELIGSFNTTNLFTAVGCPINPGRSAIFPWLYTVSNAYESYRFNSLSFTVCSGQGTTTTGRIYLYVDYDATDPKPLSAQSMMSNEGALSCPSWAPRARMVCNPRTLHERQKSYYVSPDSGGGGSSAPLYDCGILYIGTFGDTSPGPFEVYVEYDVELITPSTSTLGDVAVLSVLPGPGVANKDFLNVNSFSATVFGVSCNSYEQGLGTNNVFHTFIFNTPGTYFMSLVCAGNQGTSYTNNGVVVNPVSSTGTPLSPVTMISYVDNNAAAAYYAAPCLSTTFVVSKSYQVLQINWNGNIFLNGVIIRIATITSNLGFV